MIADLSRVLRLEVERDPDPGELLNLVPNPDGALGAWGYETPVAGSNLDSVRFAGQWLVYTSPGGVASYFYTELLPVAEGQWVAARWTAPTIDGRQVASIEWLDASKAVIGSTTPTTQLSAASSPRTYGSFQAPTGALYCRFRLDHVAAGGGNPGAGDRLWFTDLVLTAGATSTLGWTRVNLLPTPTGDGGAGGWGSGGGDVGVSSTVTLDGRKSLLLKKTGGDGPAALVSPSVGVLPGRDYAFQARSRAQGHGRHFTVAVRWFKANGDEIRTAELGSADDTSSGWTGVVGGVATAPTNAASMRLRAQYRNMDDNEVHYVNLAMIEQATAVDSWFDGSTTDADGVTYGWTGTANASTSVAAGAAGDPGELVPVPYQNILGSSSQITVDREDLNVGSMTIRLFDAVLDPTQSEIIRPGRRVRLMTTDGDVVYAGKIFTGSVTYRLLERDEQKRAEVSITAVDPINSLASAPRREGVATIAELPYVLEGAGVPWSVNGNGNQVPTADVVAYNDNASALDQVAVTRDTVLGYAWVDRNGVLQAWDRATIGTDVAAVLDESTYNADVDFSFDLDRIINSVTVRALRVIATTGASEEVTLGPYVDVDSYRQYGEHSQEYVVQGIDPDDSAAVQDYAQQILDANAQPRIRVNQLVLPIREPDDLPLALLDLYDLVTVRNDRAGVDEDARLTTIQHEITATPSGFKWLVTVGFSADGSVEAPRAVPAPPPSVGDVVDEVRGGYTGTLAELNADLDTLNNETLPAVAADLADAQTQLATLNGLFPITSTSISDGAISTPKLAANSVTAAKILAGTITGDKLVALTITGDKIAANTISADKIVANSIGAGQIAANAITAGKIAAGAIDGMTLSGVVITAAGGVSASDGNFARVSVTDYVQAFGDVHGSRIYADSVPTTGAAINAVMGASGQFLMNTSSQRYKYDIETAELDPNVIYALRPTTHRRYDDPAYDEAEPEAGPLYLSPIAEEVAELSEWMVTRDAEGEPSGLNWEAITLHLIETVKAQGQQIAELLAERNSS